MILNETLDFSTAPLNVRGAFLGTPDRVLLKRGTKLYKFTDYPLFGNQLVTPWWSYVIQTRLPSGFLAEGFRYSEGAARRMKVHHRDYQRIRSAVSEKFDNNLTNLLVIELMVDAWAFGGRVRGQPEFKDPALSNIILIGGKGQLWIPNLNRSHLREVPAKG